MAFLSLLFLPVGLMLRQQIPRLIDEVKKLLRQVPLQHIQHPVDALQQPVGKAPFFLQRLFQFHVLIDVIIAPVVQGTITSVHTFATA